MILYVTRHGQTEFNKADKICGVSDIELTEKGIQQAEELSKIVSNYKIGLIIASPLKRAYKTAEIIAENNNIPLITDDRLLEQNHGIYEGVNRFDEAYLDNKKNFAVRYPKGESFLEVVCRAYSLLQEIKEKYKEINVLLVCHGVVCRVIDTYFIDKTNEEVYRFSMDNCELKQYNL